MQVTRVHHGDSSVSPTALQSSASKELSPAVTASHGAAQQTSPADLPAGFFEAPDEAASGAASSLPQGFFDAPGETSRAWSIQSCKAILGSRSG